LQSENLELKAKVAEHDLKISKIEDNPRAIYATDSKLTRRKRSASGTIDYGYTDNRDKYAYGTGGGGMFAALNILLI